MIVLVNMIMKKKKSGRVSTTGVSIHVFAPFLDETAEADQPYGRHQKSREQHARIAEFRIENQRTDDAAEIIGRIIGR